MIGYSALRKAACTARRAVRTLAFLSALAFALPTVAASAETRVALVIGNSAYREQGLALANPVNDARAVAAALQRSGFQTIFNIDLDRTGMENALISFARAARSADVAMFYYSGHALQFDGVNYLTPVDFRELTDEQDLRRMIRVDEIVANLERARSLRILVLDSCRSNPLADTLKRSSSRGAYFPRGLAKIDAQGMIISYATQAGQTADDGQGLHSPYTEAFLRHIEQPEEIGTIFRDISDDVFETTRYEHGGGTAQLPELSLSLIGKYYLNGRPAVAGADPCAPAADHWHSAEAIGTVAAYEDHIARFPSCSFASLARDRIAVLRIASLSGRLPSPTTSPVLTTTAPAATALPERAAGDAAQSRNSTSNSPANFDGRWRVTSNVVQSGGCRPARAFSFSVANGRLSAPGLSGEVDLKGRVAGRYVNGGVRSFLDGQFSPEVAQGGWRADTGCSGRWTATRVTAN